MLPVGGRGRLTGAPSLRGEAASPELVTGWGLRCAATPAPPVTVSAEQLRNEAYAAEKAFVYLRIFIAIVVDHVKLLQVVSMEKISTTHDSPLWKG